MNIYLKILQHIPHDHSVIYRYYTDIVNEEFLASTKNKRSDGSPERCQTDSNINIFDTSIDTVDEIKNYIIKNCPPPIAWFELQEKLIQNQVSKSLDTLAASEGATFVFTKEEIVPPVNEINVEDLLNQLLSNSSTNNTSNN